jgi:hypothetical protein
MIPKVKYMGHVYNRPLSQTLRLTAPYFYSIIPFLILDQGFLTFFGWDRDKFVSKTRD